MISRAHLAALRLKKGQSGDLSSSDGSCKVWGKVDADSCGPISGSSDVSDVKKDSNYSKWETMLFKSLRKEAQDHYFHLEAVSLYKMDGNMCTGILQNLRHYRILNFCSCKGEDEFFNFSE